MHKCQRCAIFAPKIRIKLTMTEEFEKERTVIHLEINGEHHYYGSLARLFEDFTSEEIGITYGSLRNRGLSLSDPYTSNNSNCIIRKGVLLTKKGNRGRKKEAHHLND